MDNLQDEVDRCDVLHVVLVELSPPVRIPNSSQAINDDRAGISFGRKNARFLVQGDNGPLFGHGGVVLAEVLASVRVEVPLPIVRPVVQRYRDHSDPTCSTCAFLLSGWCPGV